MAWNDDTVSYRIYLADGNRIIVKAEEDFLDNVQDYKRFFYVNGYLVNINQITFIEKVYK